MIDGKNIQFLEDMSEVMKYNSSTNTTEVGSNLVVDEDLYVQTGMILSGNPQNKGGSIDLSIDNHIYLNGTDTDNNYIDFILDGTIQTALTDKNVKTLFGNSLYGTGNINLYRHQLKVTDYRSIKGIFIINSSNNLVIDSLQDLTTVTKATNGYIINGTIDAGGTLTDARLTFNGTTWELSGFTGAFDSITDVVTPL